MVAHWEYRWGGEDLSMTFHRSREKSRNDHRCHYTRVQHLVTMDQIIIQR